MGGGEGWSPERDHRLAAGALLVTVTRANMYRGTLCSDIVFRTLHGLSQVTQTTACDVVTKNVPSGDEDTETLQGEVIHLGHSQDRKPGFA